MKGRAGSAIPFLIGSCTGASIAAEAARLANTAAGVAVARVGTSAVSPVEVVAMGFEPALVERIDRMIAGSEFKRQVPPIAKLGPRTAGVDYLYPRRRPGSKRS